MTENKKVLQNSGNPPAGYISSTTLILLRLLIGVILIALFGGIIKTLLDVQLLLTHSVGESMRQILLDSITLLAVVEVLKTANGYVTDGRVRVTFIVDTVIIVILNEIMSLLFKGVNLANELPILLIIITLMGVRVIAIKWQPHDEKHH